MDESSVIEKISSGNDEALTLVYKAYRVEFISWLIKTYNCTLDEAKDTYQFSILIFYENIRNGKLIQLKSSIKTYLFAIGKNKVMEKKRLRNKFVQQEESANNIIDVPTGEMEKLHEHNLKVIERCLQKLGDPCKGILEQYYYHKKTMEEIALGLGYKNAATLKNLKYKCMNRLKKLVEEESLKTNKLSDG